MKALWALLSAVVLLGVAALVWPAGDEPSDRSARSEVAERRPDTPPAPKPPPGPAAATPTNEPSKQASKRTADPPAAAAVANVPTPAKATGPAAAGALPDGLDRTIAHARVLPGSIVRQPDGSLLADGKFRIEGEGTRAKPFLVSWDLLASSSRTYVPRLKQDGLPQWIAMLDGAWIRVDGYVAFPLMLQESAELLVMLNQWDGCCIGVPPTPYDAIEAKLVEAVKPGKRHALNFGSVTGRLRVDPLLVENWLVGLYRLEEASLTQEGL